MPNEVLKYCQSVSKPINETHVVITCPLKFICLYIFAFIRKTAFVLESITIN